MAEEEVALRLDLKNRRETAAGLRDVDGSLGRLHQRTGVLNKGMATLGRTSRMVFRGMAVGAAAAGYAAYRLIKSSISQASDLNESLNAVNVTYGKQARAVKKLGRQAATSLGLSNTAFNGLAVRFSAFAKTVGGGGRKTVKTLDALTTRAADFASVMNIEVADAADLFQSGLAGETEPLRKYGIDLSAAKIQAFAYAEGIAKTGEELTESQKVQARYASLMEQTSKTQGDFANTSDQLANQQRILSARWDNAQAKLGRGLLPIMTTFVGFINREGLPAFNRFSRWFNSKGIPAIGNAADELRPLANEILPAAGTAFEAVRDFAKSALPVVKKVVGAFNNMPGWMQKVLVGGAVGGILAKKSGLLSLLTGGKNSGGLLGSMKPVPVFVTNPGGPLGGKTPSALSPLKWIGPIAAYTAAAVANEKFPELMPFGDKGWLNKINLAPGDGNGWLSWFGGGDDKGGHLSLPAVDAWQMSPQTKKNQQYADDIAAANAAQRAAHMSSLGGVDATFAEVQQLLKQIPNRIETSFFMPGLVKNRADVNDLIKRFDLDLDRREVKTLYQVLGLDESLRGLRQLGIYANNLDGRIVDIKVQAQNLKPDLPTGTPGQPDTPDLPDKPKLPKVNGRLGPRQNTGGRGPAPAAPAAGTTLVVQTVLDGKVVAETVVEELETKMARR